MERTRKMSDIILIAPKSEGLQSGGHRYNQHLAASVQAVESSSSNIVLLTIEPSQFEQHFTEILQSRQSDKSNVKIVIDSLFWEAIAGFDLDEKFESTIPSAAILVHYLPSNNPLQSPEEKQKWLDIEERAVNKVSGCITVGKLSQLDFGKRFPLKQIDLCQPGIDSIYEESRDSNENRFKSRGPGSQRADKNQFTLLTVANIQQAKGYRELLNTLKLLEDMNTPWQWNIVGSVDGEPSFVTEFKDLVSASAIASRVAFLGSLSCDQLTAEYLKADLFLFASHFESYGMVLAEAKFFGLPVLTTEVGAASELIINSQNGYLFEAGSSNLPEKMAEKIDFLLRNPEHLSAISKTNLQSPYRTWGDVRKQFQQLLI